MAVERRRTNYTKLEKASILFYRLAIVGGFLSFFLVLALMAIFGVMGKYRSDISVIKHCIVFCVLWVTGNFSIKAVIDFLLELRYVRQKKVTKRLGLEQAFVYLGIALFIWWCIYWTIRLVYFKNG